MDVLVLDHPSFDTDEFLGRWRDARLAVLRRWLPDAAPTGESALVLGLADENHDELLRDVYLNSFRLGQSAVRHFGLRWQVPDLAAVLSSATGPCLRGEWIISGRTARLERAGCAFASARPILCDYWREAADGLVCGLSDEVRYARLQSAGRGAARCVDVLYPATEPQQRFESPPAELQPALAEIVSRFRGHGLELRFLGLAESRLFYSLTHRGGSLCGGAHDLFESLLRNNLERLCPGLGLHQATGTAVAI
jgi:hypothetical protein